MATNSQQEPIRTEREKKHARDADEGAKALVDALRPMHRPEAEAYVRKNPPSIAIVVAMAFYANHVNSKKSRPDALGIEIAKILKAKPLAKTEDVIDALRGRIGSVPEIVDVLDDGTVVWIDKGQTKVAEGKVNVSKINIGKRISRIRNAPKKVLSR